MAKEKSPETTQLDTSKLVTPNEDVSNEETPIFDATVKYLEDADEVDITHYDEDDDPLGHIGELTDGGPL